MKRITFLLLIAVTSVLVSCNVDDNINYHFEALKIKSVEMPETFEYGNIYKIKVNYLRPNDCTFFEGFDIIKEELTTRRVVAVGSVIEDSDDTCKELAEEVTATFNFEVVYTQPYLFKFWTGNDEEGKPVFTEITVPVTKAGEKVQE